MPHSSGMRGTRKEPVREKLEGKEITFWQLDERQPLLCSWDAISLSVISLGQRAIGLWR